MSAIPLRTTITAQLRAGRAIVELTGDQANLVLTLIDQIADGAIDDWLMRQQIGKDFLGAQQKKATAYNADMAERIKIKQAGLDPDARAKAMEIDRKREEALEASIIDDPIPAEKGVAVDEPVHVTQRSKDGVLVWDSRSGEPDPGPVGHATTHAMSDSAFLADRGVPVEEPPPSSDLLPKVTM